MLNENLGENAFAAYPALDFSAGLKLFRLHFGASLSEMIRILPQTGH
jgi:hypothetical protein